MDIIFEDDDINLVLTEHVYLIRIRENKRLEENVYKLGKSTGVSNRMNSYPKGSEIYLIMAVYDCTKYEQLLMTKFKSLFKQRTDYGREYFEGDIHIMMKEFNGIVMGIEPSSPTFEIIEVKETKQIRKSESFDKWINERCVKVGRESFEILYKDYNNNREILNLARIGEKYFKKKLDKSYKLDRNKYQGISIKQRYTCIVS